MAWLWVGSITVFLSIVLQIIALYNPSLPLATLGLALNAISVPFTIVQTYRSAREQSKKDLFIYSRTTEGRQLSNLSQQRRQEP